MRQIFQGSDVMRAIVNLGCIAALALGQVASLAPAMAQNNDPRFQGNNNWNNNNNNWNNNNNNNNGQTVRCESRGDNRRECRADTRGGVRINQVFSGQCQQNRDWGWRDGMIWVDNGCRAEFITGSFGGSGGSWNNNNNNWNNGGNWSGDTIRCESRNNSYRECRADTRGGVQLVRVLGGNCQQNRSWGWRNDLIWVDNGCRADFQTRGANNNNNNNSSGGSDAALIIGGVAVAAGLAALIASGSKKKTPEATAGAQTGGQTATAPTTTKPPPPANGGQPARINVPTGGVTPDARPSLQTCLNEIARQIGATGGTEIALDRFDEVTAGNGGFRFRMVLKGIYPDETRSIPTFCRATPTSVIELTFG
jgi:hypothetical protein